MAAWRKYDWKKWFGKPVTVLQYGTDYHCTQSTMIGMIRNNASQRGLKIRVKDNWTSITLEVIDALQHTNTDKVPVQHEPPALVQTQANS